MEACSSFLSSLFLSSCSAESVVDYFLFNIEGGVEAHPPTRPWQCLIRSSSSPPGRGMEPCSPAQPWRRPLLLLLLPWARGGDGRLHPRATLTTLDLLLFSSPFLCLFFSYLWLGLYPFWNANARLSFVLGGLSLGGLPTNSTLSSSKSLIATSSSWSSSSSSSLSS